MKKIKPLLLFLFILSPLASLCGCEEYVPLVTENEISQIENEEYDFKYGDVDKYTYETFLLLNKEKEKDTYYQVGPVVFKCPYDFKIIVRNKYTNEYLYLREIYKNGAYNESQLAYIGIIHRQYMKHITGKTGLAFNSWYDSNNQRMENSHYSSIDYEEAFKGLYNKYFLVTFKHEESIKRRWYTVEDFPDVEGLIYVGHQTGAYVDRDDDYTVPYVDPIDEYIINDFQSINKDTRYSYAFSIANIKTIEQAKKAEKQIKSYYCVYDVTLKVAWSGFAFDL